MPTATFEVTRQFQGIQAVDVWVELDFVDAAGSPETRRFTQRVLMDASTYHGGPKTDDRLGTLSPVRRELSDRRGQPRGITCSIAGPDVDRMIRGWLANDYQEVLQNVGVTIWTVPTHQRQLAYDPLPYFRGLIRHPEFPSDRRFLFHCEDPFTAKFAEPFPFLTLTRERWPGIPKANEGATLSPVYGLHSDEPSATSEPTLVADETGRGGVINYGLSVWENSYGDLPVAAPAGLVVTEDASAGNLPADTYAAMVTRIVDGVEGDPFPFLPDAETITVGANAAIEMTCTPDGADAYRFYLLTPVPGAPGYYRADQYIQTTDPTTAVAFTDLGPITGGTAVTAGAVEAVNPFAYLAIRAVMPDGLTDFGPGADFPNRAFASSIGYYRPIRFAWTPIVGAVRYEVYLGTHPTAAFTQVFQVPATQLNLDGNVYLEADLRAGSSVDGIEVPTGRVPGVCLGPAVDRTGRTLYFFAFAHGAVKEVKNGYLNGTLLTTEYGTTAWLPGQTGWSDISLTDYVDIAGVRYTLGALLLDPEDVDDLAIIETPGSFRINCDGVETVGDTSGTVIRSGFDQYQHALNQFGVASTSYLGGLWQASPTFSDSTPKVNVASFTAAKALAALLFPSGDDCAWFYREPITGQQFVADANVSLSVESLWRADGAFAVSIWEPTSEPVQAITETHDLRRSDFQFRDDYDQLENSTRFQLDYRHAGETIGYQATGTAKNAPSIAKFGLRALPSGEMVSYRWRTNTAACQEMADRRVYRYGRPLRAASTTVNGLHALTREAGETVTVDHGDGAGSSGWQARACRLLAVAPDHDGLMIGLDLEDYRAPLYETVTTLVEDEEITQDPADQDVELVATVTADVTVIAGSVRFTVKLGATVIGTPVTVSVIAGVATADYTIPGGTAGGAYTILAEYLGSSAFDPSSDTAVLTILPVASGALVKAIQWTGGNGDTITGVGFTPKLVLTVSCSRTGQDSFSVGLMTSVGAVREIGAGSSRGFTRYLTTNRNTFSGNFYGDGALRSDECFSEIEALVSGVAAAVNLVAMSALNSDGFTTGGGFSSANTIHNSICIGGAGVTVHPFQHPNWNTSTGSQAITGASATPALAIFLLTLPNEGFAIGWYDGTRQGVIAIQSQHSVATNVCNRYQSSSHCVAILDPDTGALVGRAAATGFTPSGVNLNWDTAYGTAGTLSVIMISGIAAHAFATTQPLATGDDVVTGLSVLPIAALLMSAGVAAGAGVTTGIRKVIGVSDGGSLNVAMWNGDDTGGTSDATRRNMRRPASAHALTTAHPTSNSAGAVDASATAKDFGPGTLTLDWDVVDGTAPQILGLALG